jgi:hypothetical protein
MQYPAMSISPSAGNAIERLHALSAEARSWPAFRDNCSRHRRAILGSAPMRLAKRRAKPLMLQRSMSGRRLPMRAAVMSVYYFEPAGSGRRKTIPRPSTANPFDRLAIEPTGAARRRAAGLFVEGRRVLLQPFSVAHR